MNRLLLLPLGVVFAQVPGQAGGGGYDYEYYDPATGATIAPAAPRPTTVTAGGSVVASPSIATFPAATTTAIPYTSTVSTIPATTYATTASFPAAISTTSFPAATTTYATTSFPAAISTTSFPAAIATSTSPYVTTALPATTIAAIPSAVARPGVPAAGAASARTAAALSPDLQNLRAEATRQQEIHARNQRIVRRAQKDQREVSLYDAVLFPGPGHSPAFAALRLGNQKKTADALWSEKRIAVQNAQVAYQRYQQNPTQLNLLISKYADLNADLRDAAHHFNVVNSGTFGQALNTGLFGVGGSTFAISYVTQQREKDELDDIQKQMKRVASQITTLAKSSGALPASPAAGQAVAQGSNVQQRMIAMNNYGPRPVGRGGGRY